MNNMDNEAMKRALANKKAMGLDLTIILGGQKLPQDDKNAELAPEVKDVKSEDEPNDMSDILDGGGFHSSPLKSKALALAKNINKK